MLEIQDKFAAAFSHSRFQYPALEYSIKLTYRVSFISFYRLCDLFRFENDSEYRHDTDMNKYRRSREFSSILLHFGGDYANTYDFVVEIAGRKEGTGGTLSLPYPIWNLREPRIAQRLHRIIESLPTRYRGLKIMIDRGPDCRGYVVSLLRATVIHREMKHRRRCTLIRQINHWENMTREIFRG